MDAKDDAIDFTVYRYANGQRQGELGKFTLHMGQKYDIEYNCESSRKAGFLKHPLEIVVQNVLGNVTLGDNDDCSTHPDGPERGSRGMICSGTARGWETDCSTDIAQVGYEVHSIGSIHAPLVWRTQP